jgi:hypothetical protein
MKENKIEIKPGFETLDEVLKSLEKSQSFSSVGYSSRNTFYSSSVIDENASLHSDSSYIRHSTPKSKSDCSNKILDNEDSCIEDDNYIDDNQSDMNHTIVYKKSEPDPTADLDKNDLNKIIEHMLINLKLSQVKCQCEDLESVTSSKSKYKKAVSFNLLPDDLNETYEDDANDSCLSNETYKLLDQLTEGVKGSFEKVPKKEEETRQNHDTFLHEPYENEPNIHKVDNQLVRNDSGVFLDKLAECINKKNFTNSSFFKNSLDANNLNYSPIIDFKKTNNNLNDNSEKSFTNITQSESSFNLSSNFRMPLQDSQKKSYNSMDILRLKEMYLKRPTESVLEEFEKETLMDHKTFQSNENIGPRIKGLETSKSTNLLAQLNSSNLKLPILKEDYMNLNYVSEKPNFIMNFQENTKPPQYNIKEAYSDSIIKERLVKILTKETISPENVSDHGDNYSDNGSESSDKDFLTHSKLILDEPLTLKYNLDKFLMKDFPSFNEHGSFEENTEKSKKVTFKVTKPVQAVNIRENIEEGLKKNLKPLGYGLLIMDLSKLVDKNTPLANQNLILNKSKKFILKNVPIFKKDVETYSPIKRIEIYS